MKARQVHFNGEVKTGIDVALMRMWLSNHYKNGMGIEVSVSIKVPTLFGGTDRMNFRISSIQKVSELCYYITEALLAEQRVWVRITCCPRHKMIPGPL